MLREGEDEPSQTTSCNQRESIFAHYQEALSHLSLLTRLGPEEKTKNRRDHYDELIRKARWDAID